MSDITSLTYPAEVRLLVIDAQNDVCHSDSDYANSTAPGGAKRDVKPIQYVVEFGIIPFLAEARKNRLPVGFIQSFYEPGQYPDVSQKWLTVDPDSDNPTWRVEIYKEMPQPGEPIFKKDTQNPFKFKDNENGLEDWLSQATDVLIAGFVSYGCIQVSVNALLERGYCPVILEDCVGASSHRIKEHTDFLNKYKVHDVIQVVNSKKVYFR